MEGSVLDFNLTPPYADYFETYYTIDRKGDFLVGDHCCQYKLTKYSATGDSLWQYIKPVVPDTFGPNVAVARLTSIDVDSANNVYAVGPYYINDTSRIVILTTKFDESGNVIWQKPFISSTVYGSYPEQIKVFANRASIAGQGGFAPPQTGSEFLLLQYDLEGNLLQGGITARYHLPTSSVLSIFSANKSSMRIIPNPFRASPGLLLSHEGAAASGILEISDSQGRLLHRQKISLQPGENLIEIDRFENFPTGGYYLQVRTEQKIYVTKAMKSGSQ